MPTIVHFDIATENPQRAKEFYESLFHWKIEAPPGMSDYFLIETENLNGKKSVGGGLGMRRDSSQRISVYIGVEDIDSYSVRVEELGGKIVQPKMNVPGWGYLAVCVDTEGNMFGLWEDEKNPPNQ